MRTSSFAIAFTLITSVLAQNPGQIVLKDMDPIGGADLYQKQRKFDSAQHLFNATRDFFNTGSNDTLLILKHFHTMQQTTEWTCGNVATLMVMTYYNKVDGETESSLASKMHTMVNSDIPGALPGSARKLNDIGTHIEELWKYFHARSDWRIISTNYRQDFPTDSLLSDTALLGIRCVGNAPKPFKNYEIAALFITHQLKAGRPIIVDWNEWGGHWTVIIGIDNGGTPELFDDDVLIMADSYDTFDRRQDGYTTVPLTQFFSNWVDTIGPKPWQLQPYIIIEPKRTTHE